jgi:hypothetical protein
VGISTVYVSGILGCNLLWQLWISFVSFYWWLKAIALYTSDRKMSKESGPETLSWSSEKESDVNK